MFPEVCKLERLQTASGLKNLKALASAIQKYKERPKTLKWDDLQWLGSLTVIDNATIR